MSQLVDRMMRAAKLDPLLYEEVEADADGDRPGCGRGCAFQRRPRPRRRQIRGRGGVAVPRGAAASGGAISGGVLGLIGGTVAALVGWLIWSLTIFFVGTRFLPGARTQADLGQVLRTVGFSAAPGVIRLFSFIPLIGFFIFVVANCWMLVAMVIAVRQALDYESTGRAILVCLIGWVVFTLAAFVLSLIGLGSVIRF